MTEIKTLTSLQIAAQCWCDPDTSHLEMETTLARAFAKRLVAEQAESDELRAENTRLKELLGQALSTLHGWAGIGNWIWPESALATAKKNTSETITAIEKEGIK